MKFSAFKRIATLLLAALVTAGLFGCIVPGGQQDVNGPTEVPATEVPATEVPATEVPATEPPKDESPYKGPNVKYVYTMEAGTEEREYEEDIIQFANDLLDPYNGHPLLSDRVTSVGFYEDNTLQGCRTKLVNMYDPDLREEFIRRINETILEIPTFGSEEDMLLRLAETAAILNDVHTSVMPVGRYELPIEVMPFYSGNGYELRITAVIAGADLDDMLLSRIDRINGFSVEECVRRISKLISHEAETFLRYEALDMKVGEENAYPYILDTGVLCYCGIMKGDTATVEVTDIDGEGWTLTLPEVLRFSYKKNYWRSGTGAEESDIGLDLMWSNTEVNEWCRLLSDGETLYFRFFSCVPEDMSVLIKQFDEIVANTDSIRRVVMDFRHNLGGYATLKGYSHDFITRLRALNADCVYVLIDHGSCSAATVLPSHLVRVLDNAKLYGMKSAQPTSFFYGVQLTFRNCGWIYSYSKYFSHFWPGNEDDALTPDVTVYQTLEDYMNGIDTVLKGIVNAAY